MNFEKPGTRIATIIIIYDTEIATHRGFSLPQTQLLYSSTFMASEKHIYNNFVVEGYKKNITQLNLYLTGQIDVRHLLITTIQFGICNKYVLYSCGIFVVTITETWVLHLTICSFVFVWSVLS